MSVYTKVNPDRISAGVVFEDTLEEVNGAPEAWEIHRWYWWYFSTEEAAISFCEKKGWF